MSAKPLKAIPESYQRMQPLPFNAWTDGKGWHVAKDDELATLRQTIVRSFTTPTEAR